MKRSPWFSTKTQPPVNGGFLSLYEHRCISPSHGTRGARPIKLRKGYILMMQCASCQWRGLLREDGGKA